MVLLCVPSCSCAVALLGFKTEFASELGVADGVLEMFEDEVAAGAVEERLGDLRSDAENG